MFYYYFLGFRLDPELCHLYRGRDLIATGAVVEFLKVLVENPRRAVPLEELQRGFGEAAVRQNVIKSRKILGDSEEKIVENVRSQGYRLNEDVYSGPVPAAPDPPGLNPEIPPRLAAVHLTPDWPGSDDFLQVSFRSGWNGWGEKDVLFEKLEGEYEPPPEMLAVMERHPFPYPANHTWSLQDWSEPENYDDSAPRLTLKAIGGDYRYVRALTDAWKCLGDAKHDECVALREGLMGRWWPLPKSPLYQNVNAEVTVISLDGHVVLCKRPAKIGFAPGVWSASVEEQMIRKHHKTGERDLSLFACARRGVVEELGVEIDSARTRLLRFGLEWGNYTACFCFVVHSLQTADEIVYSWLNKAASSQEAVAMDFVKADPKEIDKAISSTEWSATKDAHRAPSAPDTLDAPWHYTSRARLYGVARYLERL